MSRKGFVSVASKHVDAGIAKYGGTIDSHLQRLIKTAGLNYTPYLFKDGRILLVLPNNLGGILYDNETVLFASLNLGT